MPETETLTSGEVAEGAGVNIQTLRYYERRGLVSEPPRAHTGHRRYPFETVKHVRSIKQAQALGFTLDEIDELFALTSKPKTAGGAVQASAAAKLTQVDGKIAALQGIRLRLEHVLAHECDALMDCSCGADCPLEATFVPPPAEPAPAPGSANAFVAAATAKKRRGLFPLMAAAVACLACLGPALIPGLALGALAVPGGGDLAREIGIAGGAFAVGAVGVWFWRRRAAVAC